MEYGTFATILGIMFWVLCALGIVCFMTWLYAYMQYFKWDKEDRQKQIVMQQIKETVSTEVKQTLEQLDKEQYDDFENDMEDSPGGGN